MLGWGGYCSMDWFKGEFTGNPHDLHGTIHGFLMFPVDFPLNQFIEL
jgi:hypothetical protein